MKPILTITLNPTVDVACEAEEVVPVRKVRTDSERYDPGGGGINVSRVIRALGGESVALYLAGGLTGHVFAGMLELIDLETIRIPIDGDTRTAHMVFERSSGHEYRFVPTGPELKDSEWQAALESIAELDADYIVASGSLPRGAPAHFYAHVARIAKDKGARLVLDTSGAGLHWALEAGVYLVKPNLRELEHLVGRKARDAAGEEALARQLVDTGRVEVVALTLGAEGALMATRDGVVRLPSPKVEVRSAVGAGDSFVGAMTFALADGRPVADAFALGIAAGAATAMTSGTELCRREDVERLYTELRGATAN